MTKNRIVCKHHTDSLVAVYHGEIEAELEAGTVLYQLYCWPFLLKPCGCPDQQTPPNAYDLLTPDQARQWAEERK